MKRRVVVFGSRFYPRPQDVAEYVMSLPADTVVVGGCAPGVDAWALHVAEDVCGLEIDPHPADWDRYKKAAGPIRNHAMAKVSDEGMGFWDGYSKGTENMLKNLKVLRKPVTVRIPRSEQ